MTRGPNGSAGEEPYALVMVPKPPELTLRVGKLLLLFVRFGWLKVLKNSPRNCAIQRSVMRIFLNRPISQLNNPGPRRAPLPTLPTVPAAGRAKAAGFSQLTQGAV